MPHPCFSLAETPAHELIFSYITLDDDNAPADAPPLPARVESNQLRSWIDELGYGNLEIFDDALKEVAQLLSSPSGRADNFDITVGQRVDTIYDIIIAPDRMSAHLHIQPARGGRPPSFEDAMDTLVQEKVVFGVDQAAIEAALTSNKAVKVATGVEPIPGKPTFFEALVEVNCSRHPRVNESGRVNWRDLGTMPSVKAGDVLMRRHPCEQGSDGTNIHNDPVSPVPIRDIPFNARLVGVQISQDDPNVLVATEDGQPIMLLDGINVEPVASFKDGINIQTGNVDFVGSVTVSGDIQSGMTVRVGGDLTVEGVIEAADVEAGGNITVKGGILGQLQQKGGENEVQARVYAKGNVMARYVDNARILAGQSVIIQEAMTNAEVMAIDRVSVGRPGGRRGYILGGFIRATQGVFAEYIGGPGSSTTRVFVGINPLIQEEMVNKKRFLSAKVKEHADLAKVVKLLQQQPNKKNLLDKARHTMHIVTQEINRAIEEERALAADISMADAAEIEVSGGVFSGSRIAIGKKTLFIADDLEQSGRFKVQSGRAVFVNKNGDEIDLYAS